jgi:TetR/AcrR family tetracycline transcriptional repressor
MAPQQTNRQAIVDAALTILAEKGLDAVTFRNIARAVGVKAPSLYWHVSDKRELLGHLTERVFRENVLAALPPARSWQDWLRNLGMTIYRGQQQVRDVQRIVVEGRMDRAVLGEFSTILCKELVARGFPVKHAFDAQRSAMTLATGWTMIPADPNYPDDTPEPSFKRSLDALVAGWERMVAQEDASRDS